MEIELRLLRSFLAMLESASICRAAERQACTRAAMSMRLKMLESEIGAPLFLRRPPGLPALAPARQQPVLRADAPPAARRLAETRALRLQALEAA